MKRIEWVFLTIATVGIGCFFFYKAFFGGFIPFPGDSLLSDFQPWRSSSYLGYNPGSYPSKAQYPDTLRQLYPWKTLVLSAYRQGRLPLWNPYNFSGAPLLANFQSQALYPLNVIPLLLGEKDGWTILVVLQPLLALLFTYIYARKIHLTPFGASLAALSFGFSGFMSVWLEYNTVGHVILWLPLILLAMEYLREKHSWYAFALLVLANTLAMLAGHPQVYAYVLMFSLWYGAFRLPKKSRGWAGLGIMLAIGISALQLLPGIELILTSARSPHDFTNLFTKILIQPWQLLSLPFPNIFGNPATRSYWPTDTFVGKVLTIGFVPLFFLPSAIRKKDPLTLFFIAATGIILLLITANPLTYFLYQIPIPLITSSSPTLMSFLFAFSLSLLSGIGFDYWIYDRHSFRKLIVRTLEMGGLLVGIALLSKLPIFVDFHLHSAIAIKSLLYAGALTAATMGLFFVFMRFTRLRKISLVAMLLLSIIDAYIFFIRFNPYVPRALVFPDHFVLNYLQEKAPDRYWGFGTAAIPANFASQYQVFSPEGYDPLYPARYGQFLYSYKNGVLTHFDNQTRSDAAFSSQFGDGGMSETKRLKVLSALSVRYILDRTENGSNEMVFPPEITKLIFHKEDWNIFENLHAAPRTFFAQHVFYAKTQEESIRMFFDTRFDPRTSGILPASLKTAMTLESSGSANITKYSEEHIEISTKNTNQGLLILTDSYDPDWVGYIDGKKQTIYPVDTALRGMIIPEGSHIVKFEYRPQSITIGTLITALSICLTAILSLYLGLKRS